MFSSDNPNLIKSDEGFSVQVLGQAGLRYQQGGRSLRISSEVLASPHGVVVYQSSIQRWEEGNESIGDEERRSIVDNIRRAFAFRRIKVEVI